MSKKPTHFICNICRRERVYIPKRNKEIWMCKCGQAYELVATKYGYAQVIIGGKDITNDV